ncbi:MAG: hypothetical protein ACI8RD_009911, partial [Bacillariaceae sp.]
VGVFSYKRKIQFMFHLSISVSFWVSILTQTPMVGMQVIV